MKCVHSRREVRHTFQFRNDDHIMTFGSVLCIQGMKRVTMYFKHTTCPCLVIQLIVMWTCANDNNHYNLLRFCCCFYSPHAPLSLFGFPTSLSLLHPQMQGYMIYATRRCWLNNSQDSKFCMWDSLEMVVPRYFDGAEEDDERKKNPI